MPIEKDKIKQLIIAKFPDSDIKIEDLRGDRNHYELTLISEKFSGMDKVSQHRMVYDALGDIMGNDLHALVINTKAK